MEAQISREKVYDPRITQPPTPRYAVNVGGSAVTATPFRANGSTTSQINFVCNVPSQTTYLDRAVELACTVAYRFDVRCLNAQPAAAQPVFIFGRDGALEALPVHGLVSTLTLIINDASVTVDLGTTLKELLRLTDYAANRKIRTAPTMLDRYQSNATAYNAVNDPNGSYSNAVSDDEVPNGAFWAIEYVDPATGAPFAAGQASYTNPGGVGAGGDPSRSIALVNGVPQRFASGTVAEAGFYAANGYYGLAIRFRTQEMVIASPLIFADAYENSTAMFGINNLSLQFNLKADVSRTIRCVANSATTGVGRVIGLGSGSLVPDTAFGTPPSLVASNPFPEAILNCTFISPSVNKKLPAVSIVNWMEYPRYLTTYSFGTALAAGGEATGLQTSSLTIPVVPDLIVFAVKPRALTTGAPAITCYTGDWYLPITSLQLSFDNTAGLFSTTPTSQLYRISHRNGVEMNWNEWYGSARDASRGAGGLIATSGGFVAVRPGIDFPLANGLASGVSGNFVLQANLGVRNPSASAVASADIYVYTFNSGFFCSLAGSSRILRNVLTEMDVVDSPDAPENDHATLKRYVGSGFLSSLSNVLSKGIDIAKKIAPVASAIKPLLPDEGMLGSVKKGMTAVGLGRSGGGMAGGAMAGAGVAGGALAKRLM
jgi:hypothetical protein